MAGGGDDAGLVARCLAGDARAFRDLVGAYQARVYGLALRMTRRAEDAEDLTQETFVRVFRALPRYDPSRPLAAWILTITSRLCIDHHRRRRLRPSVAGSRDEDEPPLEIEDPGLRPDERAVRSEEERRVEALIATLPEHYRIVVVLRHLEDLSYQQIAEALGLPIGTVKARIHRARDLLRARYESE